MKTALFTVIFLSISLLIFGQKVETKTDWLQSYKQAVYYRGLLKGLSDAELVKRLVAADNSFYNPVFIILHTKAINKATDYLVELIQKDHRDRNGRVTAAADGKRALLICLEFYTSRKLNNIAEEEYLNWINDHPEINLNSISF